LVGEQIRYIMNLIINVFNMNGHKKAKATTATLELLEGTVRFVPNNTLGCLLAANERFQSLCADEIARR